MLHYTVWRAAQVRAVARLVADGLAQTDGMRARDSREWRAGTPLPKRPKRGALAQITGRICS